MTLQPRVRPTKITSRRFLIALCAASIMFGNSHSAGAAAPIPATQTPVAAKTPALPDAQAMVILIRSIIMALGQANITDNYSVLNALGSQDFRIANPPQRLERIFAAFRSNKIDLSPTAYIAPQLTTQPRLENGRMRLIGFFGSAPMQVNFDLMFEPDQTTWKVFALNVYLTPAPQTAAIAGKN